MAESFLLPLPKEAVPIKKCLYIYPPAEIHEVGIKDILLFAQRVQRTVSHGRSILSSTNSRGYQRGQDEQEACVPRDYTNL